MQLTDGYIKALKPSPGYDRDDQFFGLGFGVRFTWRTKTWVYSYRVAQPHGKKVQRLMTLGHYPDMSLAEARKQHSLAWARVDAGGDPKSEAEAARAQAAAMALSAKQQAERQATRGKTVRQVFEHFQRVDLTFHEDDDGERHGRQDGGKAMRDEFEKHVFPVVGDTPIREVGQAPLRDIIDDLKADGRRSAAFHVFRDLRQFLNFAVEREYIDRNPLAALKSKKVVGAPKKGKRKLEDWEITRFLRRLPVLNLHVVTQLALRFLLATGQRPEDVAGMPKAELSDDCSMWLIPAARYKTNHDQHVPLSAHARALLREAARYNGDSAYVFPSPSNKPATLAGDDAVDNPIDRHSLSKAIARKLGAAKPTEDELDDGKFDLARFTPHDLRRTMRSGLPKLGFDDGVAEKVIGHVLSGILSVYNLHTYMDERRAALEAWGRHLDSLA